MAAWRGRSAFLALGDYGLQRYRLTQSLKMTKQEVRDEAQAERRQPRGQGPHPPDPARDGAPPDDGATSPRATVVITNPTHFAVALEYRRGDDGRADGAGEGRRPHRARRSASGRAQHGVPIVENKPLAQALFKTAEVGETIPAPLFAAVAEVLA